MNSYSDKQKLRALNRDSIYNYNWSPHTLKALEKSGFFFIGDLTTEFVHFFYHYGGQSAIDEVSSFLEEKGLSFGCYSDIGDARFEDEPNAPRINGMLVSEKKHFLENSSENSEELSQIQLPFNQLFFKRIDAFDLSARTANCFISENIIYVGDLVCKTEGELLRVPNFGRTSLIEVKNILRPLNLYLGMDCPEWPPDNLSELVSKYWEQIKKNKPSFLDELLHDDLWSERTKNVLKAAKITTLSDLVSQTEAKLYQLQGAGSKTINEIEKFLASKGLFLGMDIVGEFGSINPPAEKKLSPFQDENLTFYNWKARTENALRKLDITLLSDLVTYSHSAMLRIPNLGRKSVKELEDFLNQRGLYFGCNIDEEFSEIIPPQDKSSFIKKAAVIDETMIKTFLDRTNLLNERQRNIINNRLAINTEKKTLEEIATNLGLTRERVRQLEKSALDKLNHISNSWGQPIWKEKLDTLLLERSTPLSFQKLSEEAIFNDITDYEVLSEYLFEVIGKFAVLDQLGYKFISKVSKRDFEKTVEKVKKILSQSEGVFVHEIEEKTSHLFKDIPELKNHTIRFLLKNSITSFDENDIEILTTYGERKSGLTIASGIVRGSDRILTNDEIRKIIDSEYPDMDYRTVFNRLTDLDDIYPMSHGSWGTINHLLIEESELQLIIDRLKEFIILLEKPEFHSHEFLDNPISSDIPKKLKNEFKLSAIIRANKLAKYLGRNTFGKLGANIEKRTKINDIIIEVLKRENKPVHFDTLVKEIKKVRSFTLYDSLPYKHPVIPLEKNHYGLEEWYFKEDD